MTMSASIGSPYLNPNDVTVTLSWSVVSPSANDSRMRLRSSIGRRSLVSMM